MSSNGHPGAPSGGALQGSLSSDSTMTRWQKIRLVVKVVELRLRFIALMAMTALTFAYWDTIWNRIDKWQRPVEVKAAAAHSHVEYYCPMHPSVVRDEPGSCPICGMPLSKRAKGEKETLPAGVLARVQLAPFRIEQGRIETTEVAYSPLSETLTTVGTVEFDERRQAHIASKIRGMARVEKLYVNFTGVNVAAGQTLAELYSPELYQAIQELLLARQSAQSAAPRSSLGQSLLGDSSEMTRLSVDKLKLWGMTQAQIDKILTRGSSDYKVPIVSPISGHVLKKNIFEGQYVPEGQTMFEIGDLSRVWIKAQVYEDQVGLVHLGQTVEATVEAFPGAIFPGKVAFIQPHLDSATRTVEVRYDVDNTEHKLHPGMFATVTLKTPVADTPMFRNRLASTRRAPVPVHRTSFTIEEQKVCPVTDAELGTMGPPVPVTANGQNLWTCCDACPPKFKTNSTQYLAKLAKLVTTSAPEAASPQTNCPVTGAKLGSMGDPIPVVIEGRTILTCCAACPPKLKANPKKYLARLAPPPQDGVLSVPELAVIDTGTLKMVYVETDPGVYEGRKVVLGPRTGDRFPVLEGLTPGERVVAHGAFLVDAESRLNPSTRNTKQDSPPTETMPAVDTRSARAPQGSTPHSHQ